MTSSDDGTVEDPENEGGENNGNTGDNGGNNNGDNGGGNGQLIDDGE